MAVPSRGIRGKQFVALLSRGGTGESEMARWPNLRLRVWDIAASGGEIEPGKWAASGYRVEPGKRVARKDIVGPTRGIERGLRYSISDPVCRPQPKYNFSAGVLPGGDVWKKAGHWGTHGGDVGAGGGTGDASGGGRPHGVPVTETVLGSAEGGWAHPETGGGVSKP